MTASQKKCERCSLHCNNVQHRLIVDTDISGQHTTPTIKAHAIQTQAFILVCLTFNMEPECCTETLATNYQCSQTPNQRKGLNSSLKSHKMWGFETLIHKLYIQDHFHEYSCKQSTNDMPFCIITYPPPPFFTLCIVME